MVRCPTGNRCGLWVQARSLWTGRRCPPLARRILLSRCRPPSAGLTSSCDVFSCTICPSKPLTNEASAPADGWPSSSRALSAHLHLGARAASPVSMKPENSQPLLVAIVGPTASGKSALGVCLAERLGGEVVACDSTQLYRGFDVGTAKPRFGERRGVAHHLVDVLDARDTATAGGYRDLALAVLEDLRQRRRLPVLSVGTGLYLRALLEGLADIPQRSEELRERLWNAADEHPLGYLHRILKRLDSQAAAKIVPADEQKLIRAIEVCLLAHKP